MAQIRDNPVADGLAVFLASKAAHARLMDDNGRPLARESVDVWDADSRGFVAMGVNAATKQIKPLNLDRGGRLRIARFTPMVYDQFYSNGAINPAIWQVLASTMTATQSAVTGLILNSGNSAAASVGYALKSNRRIAKQPGTTIAFRASLRVSKVTNSTVEIGFADGGAQLGVTPTALLDQSVGAYWRFTAANNLVPVISFNNTDVQTGLDVAVKPNLTDFYDYLVTVEDLGYRFNIYARDGSLVNEQFIKMPVGLPKEINQPSVSAFIGVRNAATVPASAPQVSIGQVSAGKYASDELFSPEELSALQGNFVCVTPNGLAQGPVYPASGTGATLAALTNTTSALGATLGGKFVFNAIAGAETDFGMFAAANNDALSAGMTFLCTGLRLDIAPFVAAIATTSTAFEIALFVGDSSNPNAASSRRHQVGTVSWPIGAAIGDFKALDVDFKPIPMAPNRILGTCLRSIGSTATASQIFRGNLLMKGYWVA